ncbi:MAG: TIGR00266 family protein [Acidobacteria bacterium]|jgi:uncharacterized protein (TIGR00266 family)|nr:TIGR00266 family protein [Acidobacteriota bacterium]
MNVTLKHQPAFSLAVVTLAPHEQIKVEPGAMMSHSDGLTTETKAQGGLFGGLKRMVAGESFFQNTWRAPANGGEILLTTNLLGDMITLEIGGNEFLLASGSYVASEMGISMDASWGGSKGFFGGGGLVLLKVSGQGKVIASSFGAIEERTLDPGQKYIVDTGHVVGFSSTVQFSVKKSGGWKSTILGGEGLVCELTGPGRVLMQTRSDSGFVSWLIPKLPSKSSN